MKISHLITSAILGTAMVLGAGFALKNNQETYRTEAAGDVTFTAGTDKGSNGSSGNSDTITKSGVTIAGTNLATTTAEYRIYQNCTLTISSSEAITKIIFNCTANNDSQYGPAKLSCSSGYSYSGKVGTWTGSATSVSFSATAQARASSIVVTVGEGGSSSQTINATVSEATTVIAGLASGATTTDTYCVTGYVTKIQTAYNASFGNISFWMSDTKGGTNDLEAYRAACDATTAAKILVDTKLKVTGYLQNYNGSTPELVNGSDVTILEEGTSYEEPALVTGTLSQFFADTAGNYKQRYQVTGYVTSWYDTNTDGTEYGNFYISETEDGATEYLIWGATSKASALAWDAGTGEYYFSNPKDFLTASLTKKINIGSQITMILTRADYTNEGVTTPEAKGIVTNVVAEPTELGETLLIEPEYLGIQDTSSTVDPITAETTLTASDNRDYVVAPSSGLKVYASKPNSIGDNAFASDKKVVLMGKTGAYFYNANAYEKKISSLELFAPTGASTNVQVAVEFASASDGPMTDSISSSTNAKTLSTANNVYDYSLSGMLTADYRYFRVEVLNNYNTQFQIMITFAEEGQQAVTLNSITLSHPDVVNGELPIPVGKSKTIEVSYDPENASDKTMTWSTSNDAVATVDNGVVSMKKTATVGATATITATPNDTNAQAKTMVVKATAPVVSSVDMRHGIENSQSNRLTFVAGSSLVWPEGAIKVNYSDDSYILDTDAAFDETKLAWYYSTSDSGSNDVLIDDLSTFAFDVSMKRMRLSYDGVMASARTYITVVEEQSSTAVAYAELFLELLSTGDSPVCVVTPAGVVQTDLSSLQTAWAMLADEYASLSDDDKALFAHGVASESGDSIQKALALYDFIATKYNTQLESADLADYNFMARSITPATNVINPFVNTNSTTIVVVITAMALVSVSVIGVYFLLRKKKQER